MQQVSMNPHQAWMNAADPSTMHNQSVPHPSVYPVSDPVRPRLSKQQHEILERHFQAQRKPTTSTKKGIADGMGVPLEKINNWFQNRRAKSKQEAKKAMAAIHMYPLNQPFIPQTVSLPSTTPIYNATTSQALDFSNPPPSVASIDGGFNGLHFSHQHYPSFVPTIMENPRPATSGAIIGSLNNAGYAVHNTATVNALPDSMNFAQDFGPELSTNDDFAQDFGAIQPGCLSMSQEFDNLYPTFAPIAAPQSQMHQRTQSMPTGLTTQCHAPSIVPSPNETFCDPNWSGQASVASSATRSPSRDPLDSTSAESNTTQASSPNTWSSSSPPESMLAPAGMYAHSNASVPTMSSHGQGGAGTPNSLHMDVPELPAEAGYRRNSSTAVLASGVNNIELNKRSPAGPKPSSTSSIAVRRQRHPPAALGLSSVRSASYGPGLPTSPGPQQSLAAPDHTLRRIRSSVGGSVSRIAKPVPAQRSPMALNFTESMVRQTSYSAASSSPPLPVTSGSLAPPTPLTPDLLSHFPQGQGQEPLNQINANGVPITWDADAVGAMPLNVTSPPCTPMDNQQTRQHEEWAKLQAINHFTPPQSAPATQQTFSTAMLPDHNFSAIPVSATDDKSAFVRRGSLPDQQFLSVPHDSVTGQWQNVPMFTSSGDLQAMQLNFYPMQQPTPPKQGVPPVGAQFNQHVTAPATLGLQNAVSKAELSIVQVEYPPPTTRQQPAVKAESSSASPSRSVEASRPLEFCHQGPSDFERAS